MKRYIQEALELKRSLLNNAVFLLAIEMAVVMVKQCLISGNKVLLAGNGGSAAEAQHFAGEIVSCYKNPKRRGYPAIALTTDASIVTAWSNDKSFDTLFARELEALGKSGDIFIGISTSGNSKNVIEAVKKAKEMGIKTIGFLGKDGGALKNMMDCPIVVPHHNVPRIQEIHTLLTHIVCEEVEKVLE